MRIIYVHPSLTTFGGAERVLVNKANYFAEKYGYEVYIVTAHQLGHPIPFPLSNKVIHIDLAVNFNKQYRHNFFVRGFIYLKLLHIYKNKLSKILKELKGDFTLSTISRDIDFLHSINDGSIKIIEAHMPKRFLRSLYKFQSRNFLYKIAGRIWTKRLENTAIKFDALVVLTQKDADSWSNIRQCTVIPNPLPFYPEQASNCTGKKIISVGRISKEKGYDRLVEAWALIASRYKEWKINVYGDGELKSQIKELIKEKGLSDSLILNNPENNVIEKYIESSFYVMCSRFEGFGMVLIEAMACGLPVISFNCPEGPVNIISNNDDGFLVEDGDIVQFAEKMSLLMDNEELRIEMGKRARENVKRYKQDVIMQKWVELFTSLKDKNKTN